MSDRTATYTATGCSWWHAVLHAITAANEHPGTVTCVHAELDGDTYHATITTEDHNEAQGPQAR